MIKPLVCFISHSVFPDLRSVIKMWVYLFYYQELGVFVLLPAVDVGVFVLLPRFECICSVTRVFVYFLSYQVFGVFILLLTFECDYSVTKVWV